MKLAFLTRVDAYNKNGGDTYQLEMYKKYLERNNHEVLIIDDLSIPSGQDFYILVNIDRPIELIAYYKKLKKENKIDKMFILPIHHSYTCIDFFEKNIRQGSQGIIFRLFSSFQQREKVKNIFRTFKFPSLIRHTISHFFVDYIKTSKHILNNSCGIILIAEGELENIKSDFDVDVNLNKCFIVKNGVSISWTPLEVKNEDRKIDVLVCGRIEPRKNSLAIANYFKNEKYKVNFVGALNENAKKYCNEFLQVIHENDNLEYLGKLTHEELTELYLNTKIHLSASWFEVASLVDLEAYAHGCHIISSINGHTKDYLKERAKYIDPSNLEGLKIILEELICVTSSLDEQYNYINSSFTWDHSGQELLSSFESLSLKMCE